MEFLAGQSVSLWEALLSVPDHRRSERKRDPVASLLLIDQLGIFAGGDIRELPS
jgi:hypothetical protein